MVDLRECPLPTHRAVNWLKKWAKSHPEVNPNALTVVRERIDILVKRGGVYAHSPHGLSDIMDTMIKKYNGIMYEEDGVIMEIDLFNDEIEDEPYLFGLGNSEFFIEYLVENYPEVLV